MVVKLVKSNVVLAGCLLTMLAAPMAAAIVTTTRAYADTVEPGQPCNEPSRLMLTKKSTTGEPFLVCTGATWDPLGRGVLSDRDIHELGARCDAPDT